MQMLFCMRISTKDVHAHAAQNSEHVAFEID